MLNTQLLLCFRFPQPLHPPCSAFVPSGSEPHSPVTCSLERLMSVKALSSRSWMRVFPETKQTLLRPPEPTVEAGPFLLSHQGPACDYTLPSRWCHTFTEAPLGEKTRDRGLKCDKMGLSCTNTDPSRPCPSLLKTRP